MNDTLDVMVEDLMDLLLWINDNVGTNEFSHTSIET